VVDGSGESAAGKEEAAVLKFVARAKRRAIRMTS
jgi:hypothetical protein